MWRLLASELCVTMRIEGLYIIEKQWRTLNIQNLTLGDETPEYGPRRGKLVHQFLEVINLAYYLHLMHVIHC